MKPSGRFSPDAKGWVVRHSYPLSGGMYHSWWYGPDHGFGTTYGGLGYSVAVFTTKTEAERAYRSIYGRIDSKRVTVERVVTAVAFALGSARERYARALAGDHPAKAEIAQANLDVIAYLQGERTRP